MVMQPPSPPNGSDSSSCRTDNVFSEDEPGTDRFVGPQKLRPGELAKLYVLRRVALDEAWGLLEHCPVRFLKKGEQLLDPGQLDQTLYLILSGRLTVHSVTSSKPMVELTSGESFGELSVLDDSPVNMHVIAASNTRLLAIDEERFWRLLFASHQFATNVLLLVAQHMRTSGCAAEDAASLVRKYDRDIKAGSLDDLHNRKWLDDRLPRLVMRHQRSEDALSLLVLDIDHFGTFDETYGRSAVELVLHSLAAVLTASLRPTDLPARYGSEEFAVIMPNTPLKGAVSAANRLRDAMAATSVKLPDGRVLPSITLSIGAAQLAEDEDALGFLSRADELLYRARDGGRDRVEY